MADGSLIGLGTKISDSETQIGPLPPDIQLLVYYRQQLLILVFGHLPLPLSLSRLAVVLSPTAPSLDCLTGFWTWVSASFGRIFNDFIPPSPISSVPTGSTKWRLLLLFSSAWISGPHSLSVSSFMRLISYSRFKFAPVTSISLNFKVFSCLRIGGAIRQATLYQSSVLAAEGLVLNGDERVVLGLDFSEPQCFCLVVFVHGVVHVLGIIL